MVTTLIVFPMAGGQDANTGKDGTAATHVPQTREENCIFFFSDESRVQSSHCISKGGKT